MAEAALQKVTRGKSARRDCYQPLEDAAECRLNGGHAPMVKTAMKNVLCCTAALVLLMIQAAVSQQQLSAPKLPFLDWNACPFEGCTYGKWLAESAVDVFDTWKAERKRIARLTPKTSVTGLSGVVITRRPGVIRMDRDLPDAGLRAGETILTYTYRGEGFSAVWLNGRFYSEYDISFAKQPDGSGCGGTHCAASYVDLGDKVWWAQVKLPAGELGWVNMNEAHFSGVDALAVMLSRVAGATGVSSLPCCRWQNGTTEMTYRHRTSMQARLQAFWVVRG